MLVNHCLYFKQGVCLCAQSRLTVCNLDYSLTGAPLSMELSRKNIGEGLPCPPLVNLPKPGINSRLLCLLCWWTDSLPLRATWEDPCFSLTDSKNLGDLKCGISSQTATCLTSHLDVHWASETLPFQNMNYWLPTPKIQLLSQMLSLLSFKASRVPHIPSSHMLSGTLYTLLLASLSPSFSLCLAALAFFSLLEATYLSLF